MTDRELLDKAIHWFRIIADDMERITSGNLPHNAPVTKGRAIRAYEYLEKHKSDTPAVYVVTRCEEHSDYVEAVFEDEDKAQAYCDKFNKDENEYARLITKIEITL